MISWFSFGNWKIGKYLCLLLLLLYKCICNIFRVIRIKLHKFCLAVHFYIAYVSIVIHSIFSMNINANICMLSCTLVSEYQIYTWYYRPILGLLSLLPRGLKLVKSKQTLLLVFFTLTYINLILSLLYLLIS